jgi:hypothetical protein
MVSSYCESNFAAVPRCGDRDCLLWWLLFVCWSRRTASSGSGGDGEERKCEGADGYIWRRGCTTQWPGRVCWSTIQVGLPFTLVCHSPWVGHVPSLNIRNILPTSLSVQSPSFPAVRCGQNPSIYAPDKTKSIESGGGRTQVAKRKEQLVRSLKSLENYRFKVQRASINLQ